MIISSLLEQRLKIESYYQNHIITVMFILREAFSVCKLFIVKHFELHVCMKGAIQIKCILTICFPIIF